MFLKNKHFFIQEKFDKFLRSINKIIKCDIWKPVKFQLVSFLNWIKNEMILMVSLN